MRRDNKKKYLNEVVTTGRDPKNLLKVDGMKVKTYCLKLDVGTYKWLAWKTHGRAWQEPDTAPTALRRSVNTLTVGDVRNAVGLKRVDDYYTLELEVSSPYTKMAMFNRVRTAASEALASM